MRTNRKRVKVQDETLEILRNKQLMAKIRIGLREIDAGRGIPLATVVRSRQQR